MPNFIMNRVILFNSYKLSFVQIAKFANFGKDISSLMKLNEPKLKDNNELKNPEKIENANKLQKLITVNESMNLSKVNGVPEEHIASRLVRIFKPSKNVMQSGTNNTHNWRITFETRERWENPLMGWTSSGDPLANLHLDFQNKEEAIAHCEKNGWKFIVDHVESVKKTSSKSYAVNFSWNKRTRVSTK